VVFRRARRQQPTPQQEPAAVDVSTFGSAYRPSVADAHRVREQFAQLVSSVSPGPLQERLRELGARVDAGVAAVEETARRATELERIVESLEPERVTADLKQARRAGADAEVVDALASRFASVQRLLDNLDSLRSRLPVLEARLGTAVARTAEIAFTTSSSGLQDVERDVQTLVSELESLAVATDELA
jgi:DNA repair exonuclease SbcCD ATPase subunit